MLLDEYTTRTMLEYQTAKLAKAMGAEVGDLVDPVTARHRFDVMLSAAPQASTMDSDEAAVRYALGIRGG